MIELVKGTKLNENEREEIKKKLTDNFFAREWSERERLWTAFKVDYEKRINIDEVPDLDIPASKKLFFFDESDNEIYLTTFKAICELVDDMSNRYFVDGYIFDETFEWVIATTHEDVCFVVTEKYKPPEVKPPKTGKVKLDFSKCRYYVQVFEVLREGLNLPDFLESWPGLSVCMRDYTKEDLKVEVFGLAKLPRAWDEDMEGMRRVFDKVHKDLPNITFVYYN